VEVPVQVGLTDGTNTEILSGLIEGDRVVVEYSSSSQQQQTMMFGLNSSMGKGIAIPGGRAPQGR
jgi:multidrug efflux pump subunit AcrA (membrane-fusion protein)